MKKFFLLFLGLTFLVASCSDDDPVIDPGNGNGSNGVTLNDPVNDFIWRGLNSWYNWQEDSANLSDSKDDNQDDYYTFLNGYNDYRDLMYNLCYRHISVVGAANAVDRYSWFIDDYEEQNNAFQGIRTRFGFTANAVEIEGGFVVVSILLVEQNSPAELAGLKRGDIVNAINGTVMNTGNFNSVYGQLANETATLSLVSESEGVLTPTEDITMTKAVVSANPVHYYKIFNDIGGKKVGYLLYNQFSDSYNDELNAVFAEFKAAGIDELVLDLRFNSGGSGEATTYLGSMIYAQAGTGIMYETKFNSKHSQYDSEDRFQDVMQIRNTQLEVIGEEPVNRLNTLSRLYVLTTGSTASASELVINGLLPYMNSVKLIGLTTSGKNVGSLTLYDTPEIRDYLGEEYANPAHKYAMQPICIQVFNKDGQSDYIQGFEPDIEIDDSLNWNEILPFGDRNETLLKAALDDIEGISSKRELTKFQLNSKRIDVKSPEDNDDVMYFDHLFSLN
ncbi:S41 family peptidase [Lutimonas zeaxanthinifaciens]|uniref:S41 family peptidase n=1 Tax=Lutimonas zeaxanthinifaciens TaxID=3060215 RepID=UPI00265D15DC|nr:S41 family peptidase [Lutimonas sp. YSD2104]WKK64555.1 S41 family peptidase [Lutimonas sp. YSD2104]